MMLRQHQSVPSAKGDVAENVHVLEPYRHENRPRATPLCKQTGPLLGRRENGMRTAGVRARTVKAEDGRQQPQISDSGWKGKAARAYTVAYSDLGRALDAGYYRLVGKPLKHMDEGEGRVEWQAGVCKLLLGKLCSRCPVALMRTRRRIAAGEPGEPLRTATMRWRIGRLPTYWAVCPARPSA